MFVETGVWYNETCFYNSSKTQWVIWLGHRKGYFMGTCTSLAVIHTDIAMCRMILSQCSEVLTSPAQKGCAENSSPNLSCNIGWPYSQLSFHFNRPELLNQSTLSYLLCFLENVQPAPVWNGNKLYVLLKPCHLMYTVELKTNEEPSV